MKLKESLQRVYQSIWVSHQIQSKAEMTLFPSSELCIWNKFHLFQVGHIQKEFLAGFIPVPLA